MSTVASRSHAAIAVSQMTRPATRIPAARVPVAVSMLEAGKTLMEEKMSKIPLVLASFVMLVGFGACAASSPTAPLAEDPPYPRIQPKKPVQPKKPAIDKKVVSLEYNVIHTERDSIETPSITDKVVFYKDMLFTISIAKTKTPNLNYFTIKIIFEGSRWLFLDGKIVIQADDRIIRIQDSKPSRSHNRGIVSERVSAVISEEDLIAIVNSQSTRMGFHGSPITLEEKSLGFIKRFHEEYGGEVDGGIE